VSVIFLYFFNQTQYGKDKIEEYKQKALSGIVKSGMNKDGVVSNLMNAINSMTKVNSLSSPSQAKVNNRILEIPFILDGCEHVIHVRYNRRKRNYKFNIVKDGNIYVVDHHPCTPFLVTADCLKVDEIRVEGEGGIMIFTGKDKVDF
jgi:hypothetical protein